MASSSTTITGAATQGRPILLYVTVLTSLRRRTPAIGFTHTLHPSTTLSALLTSIQSRTPHVILLPLRRFYQEYVLLPPFSGYSHAIIYVFDRTDPDHPSVILDLGEEEGLYADTDVWHMLDRRLQDREEADRDNLGLQLVRAPERSTMVPRAAPVAMYYRGMLWNPSEDDEVAGQDLAGPAEGSSLLPQADRDGSVVDEEEEGVVALVA